MPEVNRAFVAGRSTVDGLAKADKLRAAQAVIVRARHLAATIRVFLQIARQVDMVDRQGLTPEK